MGTEGIAGVVARQDWMRPLEEALQKLVQKAFANGGPPGQQVKNFLHGTWLGHPLHVILTDLPIGMWTAALTFDALDTFTPRRSWRDAAEMTILLGLVGAGGAAITGLTDWQDTDPPARRIGLTHALLNIGGVALFSASLVMRKRRSETAGRLLSLLGYALAGVSAHLGGNLVYDQRIGVDHNSGQALPETFVPVLAEPELLDGRPRRAVFEGVPILLVRRGSHIFALAETCSHLGGPLAEGTIIDNSVKCPWHGSRFSLEDGRVLDGPAVHPQPCLVVRVRDGKIEVRKPRLDERATGAEQPWAPVSSPS